MRKRRKIVIAALAIIAVVAAGWHLLPTAAKARVMRSFSTGGSYQTYDRLADMLQIGMTTEEVQGVLGAPDSVYQLPAGFRWLYNEAEATTGWLCIVDFAPADGAPRLQYFRNVEHIVFPTSRYREFGRPIYDDAFEDVSLPRMKRN